MERIMNEFTYEELINAFFDKELNVPIISEYVPSFRHRRTMKKIFSAFQNRNTAKSKSDQDSYVYSNRRMTVGQKVRLILLVILCAALIAGCGIAIVKYYSKGFSGTVYDDNTWIMAEDIENAPQTIEREYVLSVPDGFEITEKAADQYEIYIVYTNSKTGDELIFTQTIKKAFETHLNTERYQIEEININGFGGIGMDLGGKEKKYALIFWNSSDYILTLYGNFTKSELINLAIINENSDFKN